MSDRTYLVRFKAPSQESQLVTAAAAEIYGEHLVMLNSKNRMVAMFLLEYVESWQIVSTA
jgi:hypothetical protein